MMVPRMFLGLSGVPAAPLLPALLDSLGSGAAPRSASPGRGPFPRIIKYSVRVSIIKMYRVQPISTNGTYYQADSVPNSF